MREARMCRKVCWELRGQACVVKCTLEPAAEGIALIVRHGHNELRREVFRAAEPAHVRALEWRDRLLTTGWQEVSR